MKKNKSIKIWSVLLWVVIWQIASMIIGKDILLVSPIKVIVRLAELCVSSVFWESILFSLVRISGGFFLAVILGVILAGLASKIKAVREFLTPMMLVIKATPVASFIILALIWFSSHNLSILISFLMVLPIIYTNVLDGIWASDKLLIEMAEVYNIPFIRKVRYILIPQVMPFFRTGCNVALGLCWKSGIAAEVIGMPDGSIGEHLQQAKIYLDTPDLFAWTIVIILVSTCFEKVVIHLIDLWRRRLERM